METERNIVMVDFGVAVDKHRFSFITSPCLFCVRHFLQFIAFLSPFFAIHFLWVLSLSLWPSIFNSFFIFFVWGISSHSLLFFSEDFFSFRLKHNIDMLLFYRDYWKWNCWQKTQNGQQSRKHVQKGNGLKKMHVQVNDDIPDQTGLPLHYVLQYGSHRKLSIQCTELISVR